MEAQHEKRVKLVFWRRKTEISRMEVEKWLRKRIRGKESDLSHSHHLRAHRLRLVLPQGGERDTCQHPPLVGFNIHISAVAETSLLRGNMQEASV